MTLNAVNDLQNGAGMLFEFGRAKEARRVFHRPYADGRDGLGQLKLDATLPRVGDFYSNEFLELRASQISAEAIGGSADGKTEWRIVVEYIDVGYVHIQFGATTATITSPFDLDGNRNSVSYNGDEYVGLVEVEETRMTLEIERVVSISPYVTTIAAWVEARENKCNAATFLGHAARCWRIAQIDAELLFETYDFGVLVDRTYRVRYFLEQRPARSVELIAGGGLVAVPGWDELKYYEADGGVPVDAEIEAVVLYDEADFSSIFSGIQF